MKATNVVRTIRLVGLLAACPAALAARAPLASAPLMQVSNVSDTAFMVPVTIGPLRDLVFLVDTAASRTVITPSVRNALGLHGTQASFDDITGAGGRISAQGFILPSIAVGREVQRDLRVVVVDLARKTTWMGKPLDGILGTDFLRNYNVRLDGPAATLQLYPLSDPLDAFGADAVVYTMIPFDLGSGGFAVIPIRVNGQLIRGVLDTGASRSVLNHLAANLAGIPFAGGPAIDMMGADCNPVSVVLQRAERVELGGIAYRDEIVSVGDLPLFHQLDLDKVPAMILGAGSVRDRTVLISYSTHALFLARETAALSSKQAAVQTPRVLNRG